MPFRISGQLRCLHTLIIFLAIYYNIYGKSKYESRDMDNIDDLCFACIGYQ